MSRKLIDSLKPLETSKTQIRAQVRDSLRRIPVEERRLASARSCDLLQSRIEWRNARSVLFYAPLADELDLSPLWRIGLSEGKIVALPRFSRKANEYVACAIANLKDSLPNGKFGIPEPGADSRQIPLNQLDLVMVPGVAYDLSGRRVGRGRGFYDRMLANVRGTKCGVAFEQQILGEVPVEPHDVRLDCLLTPTRWICCGQSSALK